MEQLQTGGTLVEELIHVKVELIGGVCHVGRVRLCNNLKGLLGLSGFREVGKLEKENRQLVLLLI